MAIFVFLGWLMDVAGGFLAPDSGAHSCSQGAVLCDDIVFCRSVAVIGVIGPSLSFSRVWPAASVLAGTLSVVS